MPNTPPFEKQQPEKPAFLEAMTEDRPELAAKIEERIPAWKEHIADLTGNKELAEAVLEHLKYVSKQETLDYISSVADEAQECLDRGEEVVFLGFHKNPGGSQSNGTFYEQAIKSHPELEGKAKYVTVHEIDKVIEKNDGTKLNVFVLDDSSMSGSQLYGNLLAWVRPTLGSYAFMQGVEGKDISVKVRVMYEADNSRVRYHNLKEDINTFENPKNKVTIDQKTTEVPDVVDVVEELGLVTKEHDVLFDFDQTFLFANHGMNGGTLLIFSHKVPDNSSVMVIEGTYSKRLGITPLLDKDMEAAFGYDIF